ncbi:MAG: hypothetical protein SGJ02_13345 [bacterium]|nr:hypothetical protein [bacterium]
MPFEDLQPHADADLYVSFAKYIESGSLFNGGSNLAIPQFSLIRTPGYPFFLYLVEKLFGQNHIVFSQILLGAITIVISSFLLRLQILPILSGLIFCIVLYCERLYAHFAITEWLALNILLLFSTFIFRYCHSQNWKDLFCMSLLAGFSILVRPALIITIFIPLYFIFANSVLAKVKKSFVVLSGIMPVLLWCFFNLIRVGSFNLTAFDGMSLFGVGTLVGSAEVKETDSEDLKSFITEINYKKIPELGAENFYIKNLKDHYQPAQYNHNLYRIGLSWATENNVSTIRINELMRIYAVRSIGDNLVNYLRFVSVGLYYLLSRWMILISALILVLVSKKYFKQTSSSKALFIILILHLAHCFLCSTTQILVLRYFNLSYYLLLSAVLISFITTLSKMHLFRKTN